MPALTWNPRIETVRQGQIRMDSPVSTRFQPAQKKQEVQQPPPVKTETKTEAPPEPEKKDQYGRGEAPTLHDLLKTKQPGEGYIPVFIGIDPNGRKSRSEYKNYGRPEYASAFKGVTAENDPALYRESETGWFVVSREESGWKDFYYVWDRPAQAPDIPKAPTKVPLTGTRYFETTEEWRQAGEPKGTETAQVLIGKKPEGAEYTRPVTRIEIEGAKEGEPKGVNVVWVGTETDSPEQIEMTPQLAILKQKDPKLFETLRTRGIDAYNTAAGLEGFVARSEQERFKKLNIKLPDGQWIAKADLESIKKDSPEVHTILITKGYQAADEYVSEYNKSVESYNKNVAMVEPYTIKEGEDKGKIDLARLMSSGNEQSIKVAKQLWPEAFADAPGLYSKEKFTPTSEKLTPTLPYGPSWVEKTAFWEGSREYLRDIAKDYVVPFWNTAEDWENMKPYEQVAALAGDVGQTILIGVGAFQIASALRLRPPKVILPPGSGGVPKEAYLPKTTLKKFKEMRPYELDMSISEYNRLLVAKAKYKKLDVGSFRYAEDSHISFEDAIKLKEGGGLPIPKETERMWKPQQMGVKEETPRTRLKVAVEESGLTGEEFRKFVLAREVNPSLTPEQFKASLKTWKAVTGNSMEKARVYESAFKKQVKEQVKKQKVTLSSEALGKEAFAAYRRRIEEEAEQLQTKLREREEFQRKLNVLAPKPQKKEGIPNMVEIQKRMRAFQARGEEKLRQETEHYEELKRIEEAKTAKLWKPKPIEKEEVATQVQTETATKLSIQLKTALETATAIQVETQTKTKTALQTALKTQVKTALLTATQLQTALATKTQTETQTKLALQLQTQLKLALQTETETETKKKLRGALKILIRVIPPEKIIKEPPAKRPPVKPPPIQKPPKPPTKKPPIKKPPKKPPIIWLKEDDGREVGKLTKRELKSAVAWKQGIGWWVVLKDGRNFFTRKLPEGVTVEKPSNLPRETIQAVAGKQPFNLSADLGNRDIHIVFPEGKKQGRIAFTLDPMRRTRQDIQLGKSSMGTGLRSVKKGKVYHTPVPGGTLLSRRPLGKIKKG